MLRKEWKHSLPFQNKNLLFFFSFSARLLHLEVAEAVKWHCSHCVCSGSCWILHQTLPHQTCLPSSSALSNVKCIRFGLVILSQSRSVCSLVFQGETNCTSKLCVHFSQREQSTETCLVLGAESRTAHAAAGCNSFGSSKESSIVHPVLPC